MYRFVRVESFLFVPARPTVMRRPRAIMVITMGRKMQAKRPALPIFAVLFDQSDGCLNLLLIVFCSRQ